MRKTLGKEPATGASSVFLRASFVKETRGHDGHAADAGTTLAMLKNNLEVQNA